MRHYYINRGRASNEYELVYTASATQDAAAEAAGYERITRRRAIDYCIAERRRRKWEPSSAYFAAAYIWPYNAPYDYCPEPPRGGYIIERAR